MFQLNQPTITNNVLTWIRDLARVAIVKKLLYVGAICAIAASLLVGVRNGWMPMDFQWQTARDLWCGVDPYQADYANGGFYACYPPSSLFFLGPWAIIRDAVLATRVWLFCNLFFTIVLVWGVCRLFDKCPDWTTFWWGLALLVAGMPWRVQIACGQHTLFSLMFFVWALVWARRGNWILSGLLLSPAMFKYTVTGPLVLTFLVFRHWRPVALMVGVHAALSCLAGWWVNESPIKLVSESIVVGGRLIGEGCADFGSLMAVLGVSHGGVRIATLCGYVVFGCGMVVFTAIGALKRRPDNRDYCLFLVLSIFSLFSNMVVYHRCYDLVTLLFPLALCITTGRRIILVLAVVNVMWTFFGLRLALSLAPVLNSPLTISPLQVVFLGVLGWEFWKETERDVSCHGCEMTNAGPGRNVD